MSGLWNASLGVAPWPYILTPKLIKPLIYSLISEILCVWLYIYIYIYIYTQLSKVLSINIL